MKLKRHYDLSNPSAPRLTHVEVKHTGSSPEQNFSIRLVNAAVVSGWMTLSRGKLILHALPEDLEYEVLRVPGTYCCHCGACLESGGATAQAHVTTAHTDATSPDPESPAGYVVLNHYACRLGTKQHDRYKLGAL